MKLYVPGHPGNCKVFVTKPNREWSIEIDGLDYIKSRECQYVDDKTFYFEIIPGEYNMRLRTSRSQLETVNKTSAGGATRKFTLVVKEGQKEIHLKLKWGWFSAIISEVPEDNGAIKRK